MLSFQLKTGRKYYRAAAVNQRQRADRHSQLGMTRREGGGGFNELVAALQGRLVGWLVGCLVGWLVGRLFPAKHSSGSAALRTLAGG